MADKLTSEIFVHKSLRWALYHVWLQNLAELYNTVQYYMKKLLAGITQVYYHIL